MAVKKSPKVYVVTLTDRLYAETDNYYEIIKWTQKNCKSLVQFDSVDVSDVSGHYDSVETFKFTNSKDVVAFKLRWQ